MNIIFAGTPEFARVALVKLLAAGHNISLVLTQPDRQSGRGMKVQPSPVKQFANERSLAVIQPRSLRLEGKYPRDAEMARELIKRCEADVMVVAAYGLILPQWTLDLFSASSVVNRHGCINIHGSLLPRWRGAAPIHRAIEAGDAVTGVTIMQMDAGLDTGDILMMKSLAIDPTDTTRSLHDKVASLGGEMVVATLAQVQHLQQHATKQPEAGICYAHKIEKHEAAIDWALHAVTIVRRVRAFDPFPGATVSLHGILIKVWSAKEGDGHSHEFCGTVIEVGEGGIAVAATNSIVLLTELQRPGGKRLSATEFVRGFDLRSGMRFDQVPALKT